MLVWTETTCGFIMAQFLLFKVRVVFNIMQIIEFCLLTWSANGAFMFYKLNPHFSKHYWDENYIPIYKDTVPWPLYICTVTDWTLLFWVLKTHSYTFWPHPWCYIDVHELCLQLWGSLAHNETVPSWSLPLWFLKCNFHLSSSTKCISLFAWHFIDGVLQTRKTIFVNSKWDLKCIEQTAWPWMYLKINMYVVFNCV